LGRGKSGTGERGAFSRDGIGRIWHFGRQPPVVHITVPKLARLRREQPKWIAIHRADLAPEDVAIHEGLPLTSIAKTVSDILASSGRTDLVRQAIADARKEGYIAKSEAERLKRQVDQFAKGAGHNLRTKESYR